VWAKRSEEVPANLGARWDAEGVPRLQNQSSDQCDSREEVPSTPIAKLFRIINAPRIRNIS